MDSLTSNEVSSEIKEEPFVPKRRAPYLLQDELIHEQEILNAKNNLPVNENNKIERSENISDTVTKEVVNLKQKKSYTKAIKEEPNKPDNNFDVCDVPINFHEEVSRLYGLQKKLIHFFVDRCSMRKENLTGPTTLETLIAITGSSKLTTKKILERLKNKKLIERLNGKRGKGGFTFFKLPQELIDVVRLQMNLEHNYSVTHQSQVKQEITNIDSLPDEWKKINCEPIESIGFGLPQLRQIYSKNTNTPEVIQQSINHFAYTLKYKPEKLQKYDSKIAVFMSTMNKGSAWVESDYMSPTEMAVKELHEQKKERMTRVTKMEEEIFLAEFEEWLSFLSQEEQQKIVVEKSKGMATVKLSAAMKKGMLNTFFKTNIWPQKTPIELVKLKDAE